MVDYLMLLRLMEGKVTFYHLPAVKRNKEVLFKLLRLDRSRQQLDKRRLLGSCGDLAVV